MKRRCDSHEDFLVIKQNDCILERFLSDVYSCCPVKTESISPKKIECSKLCRSEPEKHHLCLRKNCIYICECNEKCSNCDDKCGNKLSRECLLPTKSKLNCELCMINDDGRLPVCKSPQFLNVSNCMQEVEFNPCYRNLCRKLSQQIVTAWNIKMKKYPNCNLSKWRKEIVKECAKESYADISRQIVKECCRDLRYELCKQIVKECARESCSDVAKKIVKQIVRQCENPTSYSCERVDCECQNLTSDQSQKLPKKCESTLRKRESQCNVSKSQSDDKFQSKNSKQTCEKETNSKPIVKEGDSQNQTEGSKSMVKEISQDYIKGCSSGELKHESEKQVRESCKETAKKCKSDCSNVGGSCFENSGILVVGGITNLSAHAENRGGCQMWLYLIQEKIWRDLPPLPESRHNHGACMHCRNIYVTGGINPSPTNNNYLPTCTTFLFEPCCGKWLDSLPLLLCPRSHHKMVSFNNLIWVLGGKDDQGRYLDTMEYLNFEIQQWTKTLSMMSPRGGLGAAVYDNQIFVVGGRYQTESRCEPAEPFETMSFDGNMWCTQPNLESGIFCAGLVNASESLYLIGGAHRHLCSNSQFSTACFSSVIKFCTLTKNWQRIQNLCIPRYNMGCVSCCSRIFVIGGITVDPLSEEMILLDSVECYDTTTNCMMKMFKLPCAAAGLECILIPDLTIWCKNDCTT